MDRATDAVRCRRESELDERRGCWYMAAPPAAVLDGLRRGWLREDDDVCVRSRWNWSWVRADTPP